MATKARAELPPEILSHIDDVVDEQYNAGLRDFLGRYDPDDLDEEQAAFLKTDPDDIAAYRAFMEKVRLLKDDVTDDPSYTADILSPEHENGYEFDDEATDAAEEAAYNLQLAEFQKLANSKGTADQAATESV